MSELQLVEYQDSWPSQFQQVAADLRAAVAIPGAIIEHIGSTSVPGLCSKPVLDILLGVTSLSDVEAAVPSLALAGFAYRPGYERQIPDRRYFVRASGSTPRVHLHAVVHASDKAAYTAAKAPFIQQVLSSCLPTADPLRPAP